MCPSAQCSCVTLQLPLDAHRIVLLVKYGNVVSHKDISQDHEWNCIDAIEQNVAVVAQEHLL